ncbi:MFS transporter [Curvibacter sp. APW13]|uniref:MFS transporter n=1 Tax=Curvibacter sp. APW13 TaxID=3077236 RepID=UPI0028DDF3F5|nr:MFS transporter [Curvibacter sp. APW13]MDT8989831.1 MFS transporter [Curvibacter sp. APW13]
MTKAPSEYRPAWVVGLSLAQLISWGSVFYTFALLVEPVERELGMDRVGMSLAFSLALLAEGLLAYPVGQWIDRGHERRVMAGGTVLAALCLGLHRWVDSAPGFYALWVGLGAAMACVLYSPAFAVVTRRFPADFRRAIITMTFLGGLASTVFIPLGAWGMATIGWRDTLLALAALHLLVCLPLHLLLLRGAPAPQHPSAAPQAEEPTGDAPRALMRSAPFVLIGAFMVLMTAATASLPAHMISLLREHALPEAWVIAIPASIGAFQVLGRVLLFVFERRLDVHRANRWIPALIPLGLAALLASPWLGAAHQAVVLLFVVLFGMGNGMLTIVKGTALAQYVSQRHVAALNGALGLPQALVRAAAPLGLGWAWSLSGSYTVGLCAVVALTSVGVWALARAQARALV